MATLVEGEMGVVGFREARRYFDQRATGILFPKNCPSPKVSGCIPNRAGGSAGAQERALRVPDAGS